MITLRYALMEDEDFWMQLDRHISVEAYRQKVRDKQGYIICMDGRPAGVLRYGLFWDNIPFLHMLYLKETLRRQGIGRDALRCWEQEMRAQGHTMVLTSARSDEEAQHFYRRQGYRDCGVLVLEDYPHAQPMELFLRKNMG